MLQTAHTPDLTLSLRAPDGATATLLGLEPTGTVAITVLALVSITDTVLLAALAT